MMFGWLMKRIFVDKRARERMNESRKAVKKGAVEPVAVKEMSEEQNGAARKKLIQETMALYREKRVEYEKLDKGLRDKIDKAAREAFGGKKE